MEKREITRDYGSIMVLVPHQDDEILMCAGIMESAVKSGVQVTVVMVTNGDYGCGDFSVGRARLRETLEGLKVLGISEEQAVFLGYADTGMPEEDSFLYGLYGEEDGEKVHPSHCGSCTYGLPEKEEFHKEEYGEHGAYTRNGFAGDLKAVLMKYRPEHIFTTSKEDTHGDHSGLFLFVRDVLRSYKEEGYCPRLYCGIVHSKAGDEDWPERGCGVVPFGSPEDVAEKDGGDAAGKNGEDAVGKDGEDAAGKNGEAVTGKDREEKGGAKGEESAKEEKGVLGSLVWEERMVFPVPDSMRAECLEENKKAVALSKHVTALKPDAVDFLYAFIKADEVFWEIVL